MTFENRRKGDGNHNTLKVQRRGFRRGLDVGLVNNEGLLSKHITNSRKVARLALQEGAKGNCKIQPPEPSGESGERGTIGGQRSRDGLCVPSTCFRHLPTSWRGSKLCLGPFGIE